MLAMDINSSLLGSFVSYERKYDHRYFVRKALDRQTFDRQTFGLKTFGRKTFGLQTFGE
jgi:hypothetical protein